MRLGFIIGKNSDSININKELKKIIPPKFIKNNIIYADIAIPYYIKYIHHIFTVYIERFRRYFRFKTKNCRRTAALYLEPLLLIYVQ